MSRNAEVTVTLSHSVTLPRRDRFGPWADDITDAERRARLRCMRGLVRLLCGPRGRDLTDALAKAERDTAALAQASRELARLAPTDRRHVLATFAALHRQP
jgi:hypothetical protein